MKARIRSDKDLYNWLFEDADPAKIPDDKFPLLLGAVKKELAAQLVASGADSVDGGSGDDVVGIEVDKPFKCLDLKPSQSSMNINKAWQFALSMINNTMPPGGGPGGNLGSFISNDMYIMDGHHRWIATGMVDPSAELKGYYVNLPGVKLVAVLNTITKGLLNVEAGNPGTGGFDQFKNPAALKSALELQINGKAGNEQGPIKGDQSAEGIKKLLLTWTGTTDPNTVVDAAVAKVVENLAPLLANPIMPGAPDRKDMPVIDDKKSPDATNKTINALTQGLVDLNPPFKSGEGAAGQEGKEPIKESYIIRRARPEPSFDVNRWQRLAGIKR